MRRTFFVLAASTTLALGIGAGAAVAVPAGGATVLNPSGDAGIVKVHGGHGRYCEFGPIHRWNTRARHRHFGNQVSICGKRWRGHGRPPRHRERGCFIVGPVWYCP